MRTWRGLATSRQWRGSRASWSLRCQKPGLRRSPRPREFHRQELRHPPQPATGVAFLLRLGAVADRIDDVPADDGRPAVDDRAFLVRSGPVTMARRLWPARVRLTNRLASPQGASLKSARDRKPIGLRRSRLPPGRRAASLLRRLRTPGRATVRHPPLADALEVSFELCAAETPHRRRRLQRHVLAILEDEAHSK